MLAAKRTARVPGRITLLTVSIRTIKGIRTGGVPKGTKCASIWVVWLSHPYKINANQRGKARAKVMAKWLEAVNTYGASPKKLLNRINKNREIKISVCPWAPPVPTRVLNSMWSWLKIRSKNLVERLLPTQKLHGRANNPTKIANQFSGRVSIEEGSKIENKLAIIFNLRKWKRFAVIFLDWFF